MLALLLSILVADFLVSRWLDYLNLKNMKREIPSAMFEIYNQDQIKKSLDYEKAKIHFGMAASAFSLLIMIFLLWSGSFALLHQWTLSVTSHPAWNALFFFACLAVLSDVLNLPFTYYKTFILEEKFGFNRTTISTFITDKFKNYFVGILLGGSLLFLFIWIYNFAGPLWWIYVFAALSLFLLFSAMFYSSLILPLFNKLSPLPEGSLRTAIENYCRQAGFSLKDLFVMDGSKRSSKANAFFSGIGRKKRIVLFDTLIANHTEEELVAVLAHEIGHYKKKHTQTGLLLSLLQMVVMLFIFSKLIEWPELSQALGGKEKSLPLGMLAFGILYSPLSMVMGLGMNFISRKHEFEADAFARETYSGKALIEALKKLSVNNLSNPVPHPLFVVFNYSHPPLLQRLHALRQS